MKELSKEEKAARYDELYKEVRDFFEGKQKMCSDVTKALESLFPELVGSEDERVKKELINAVQGLWDYDALPMPLTTKRRDEWLAWLEKQGEQKSWGEEDENHVIGIIQIIACAIKRNVVSQKTGEMEISWLKSFSTQNIQKPVDKVKPKFKLYDWVITDKGDVVQIGAVNNGYYTLYNGMDFGMSYADRYWHKWTIQDAKDGDVLALNNEVFIYAHRKQMYPVAVAHCYVDSAGGFYRGGEFSYIEKGNSISPATKEQRDLLEKAMTDAGYIFDFKKKELEEITAPKSEADDKIEPRFKVGDWVVANYTRRVSQVVDVTEDGYGYTLNDGLCFGVSWCDIFHLWCIKDANEGDVLASEYSVFIFKGEYAAGKPEAYCGIMHGRFILKPEGCWTNENITPATKEQQNVLQLKMKEAGVIWDSENKKMVEIKLH